MEKEVCHYTPNFSFIYVNLAFIATALVLIFLFSVFVAKHFGEIIRYHSTISSFCANPKRWGNRFLLLVCFIIGGNLSCILVEEYNARTDRDNRFWLEISATCTLTAIGFFYTRGDGKVKNVAFTLGIFKLPIIFSILVHSICALFYFFVLPVCNITYNLSQLDNVYNRAFFVLDVIAIIGLFALFTSQTLITILLTRLKAKNRQMGMYRHIITSLRSSIPKFFCVPKKSPYKISNNSSSQTTTDIELSESSQRSSQNDAMEEDVIPDSPVLEAVMTRPKYYIDSRSSISHPSFLIGKEPISDLEKELANRVHLLEGHLNAFKNEVKDFHFVIGYEDRELPKYIKVLYAISFVSEFVMTLFVTISTMLCSVKRNPCVNVFKT